MSFSNYYCLACHQSDIPPFPYIVKFVTSCTCKLTNWSVRPVRPDLLARGYNTVICSIDRQPLPVDLFIQLYTISVRNVFTTFDPEFQRQFTRTCLSDKFRIDPESLHFILLNSFFPGEIVPQGKSRSATYSALPLFYFSPSFTLGKTPLSSLQDKINSYGVSFLEHYLYSNLFNLDFKWFTFSLFLQKLPTLYNKGKRVRVFPMAPHSYIVSRSVVKVCVDGPVIQLPNDPSFLASIGILKHFPIVPQMDSIKNVNSYLQTVCAAPQKISNMCDNIANTAQTVNDEMQAVKNHITTFMKNVDETISKPLLSFVNTLSGSFSGPGILRVILSLLIKCLQVWMNPSYANISVLLLDFIIQYCPSVIYEVALSTALGAIGIFIYQVMSTFFPKSTDEPVPQANHALAIPIAALTTIAYSAFVGELPSEATLKIVGDRCAIYAKACTTFDKVVEAASSTFIAIFNTLEHYITGKPDLSQLRPGDRERLENIYDFLTNNCSARDISTNIRNPLFRDQLHQHWVAVSNLEKAFAMTPTNVMAPVRAATSQLRSRLEKIAELISQAGYNYNISIKNLPLTVFLAGRPGSGKSTICDTVTMICMRACGVAFDPTSMNQYQYRRTNDQYWSGYTGQFAQVFDDFWMRVDTPGNPNPEIADFMNIYSDAPLALNMADISSKGNVFHTSSLVMATSNTETFCPKSISNGDALDRRIDMFFRMVVKEDPSPSPFTVKVVVGSVVSYRFADAPSHDDYRKFVDFIALKDMNFGSCCIRKDQKLNFDEFCKAVDTAYRVRSLCSGRKAVRNADMLDYLNTILPQMNSPDDSSDELDFLSQNEIDDNEFDGVYTPLVNLPSRSDYGGFKSMIANLKIVSVVGRSLSDNIRYQTLVRTYFVGLPFSVQFNVARHLQLGLISKLALENLEIDPLAQDCFEINCPFYNYDVDDSDYSSPHAPVNLGRLYDRLRLLNYAEANNQAQLAGCKTRVKEEPKPPLLNVVMDKILDSTNSSTPTHLLIALGLTGVLAAAAVAGYYIYKSHNKDLPPFPGPQSDEKEFKQAIRKSASRKISNKEMKHLVKIRDEYGFSGVQQLLKSLNDAESQSTEAPSEIANATSQKVIAISNNIYELHGVSETNKRVFLGSFIFLRNNIGITFRHGMESIKDRFKRYTLIRPGSPPDSGTIVDYDSRYVRYFFDIKDRARDIVMVQVPTMAFKRDIVKYIGTEAELNAITGEWCGIFLGSRTSPDETSKGIKYAFVYDAKYHSSMDLKYNCLTNQYIYSTFISYKLLNGTIGGDCGSAILNHWKNDVSFNSLHVAGNAAGVSFAGCFHREEILDHLNVFIEGQIEQEERVDIRPVLSVPVYNDDTNEIYAPVKLRGETEMDLLGTVPKALFANTKTSILESGIHGKVPEFPPIKCPAKLAPFQNADGSVIDPLLLGLQKFKHPPEAIPTKEATDILDTMCPQYFPKLNNSRVLTYEESAFGSPDFPNLNPIDRTTGSGYELQLLKPGVGKTPYLGKNNEKIVNPDLIKRLDEQVDMMKKNITPTYIFSDTLKDERVSQEKAKIGKTRLFTACPLDFLILFRCYFGPYLDFITVNRVKNGIAVGVNVYGPEWEQIRVLLSMFCNECFDGDYKFWDSSLMRSVLKLIGDYIIASLSTGNKVDDQIRYILWTVICNAIHISGNMLYLWPSGMPSGCPITSILNSLYNVFINRLVFYRLRPKEERSLSFENNVSMICYGDDNVLNVTPDVRSWFNPSAMRKEFQKLGMDYTSADKKSDPFFKPVEEAQFLKRGFKYHPDLKCTAAPLDFESIQDMVHWINAPTNQNDIPERSVIATALEEAALHGEAKYVEFSTAIYKALRGWNRYTVANITVHSYTKQLDTLKYRAAAKRGQQRFFLY